jgi:hypothetical protein
VRPRGVIALYAAHWPHVIVTFVTKESYNAQRVELQRVLEKDVRVVAFRRNRDGSHVSRRWSGTFI